MRLEFPKPNSVNSRREDNVIFYDYGGTFFFANSCNFPPSIRGQSCQSEFMRFPHKIFAAPLQEEEMNSNIRTFSKKFILTWGPPPYVNYVSWEGRVRWNFLHKVNRGEKIRFSKIHFMSILASIHGHGIH